jgi:hypothetical protein
MEIGEFTSACLNKLIRQEKYMKRKFGSYCRQHSKVLTAEYFLGENQHTLKFNLTDRNGNIGKISISEGDACD